MSTLILKVQIGNSIPVASGTRVAVFWSASSACGMAAHGNNFIRVRLHFDYPPPAVVDCRMCWLLVDLNACRVVADLESVIREKFEFGRGSILSLFVEDCYLPHTESVYVVRDNDSVRVKVDCLAQVNGHSGGPDASSETCRKRARPAEEDGPGENGVIKKKRKKRSEETAGRDTCQASADERSKKTQGKKKKKKKSKKAEEKSPTVTTKPAASTKKSPVKIPKKPPVAQSEPQKVSSSDSSSEEDKAPKRPAAQKPAPKTPSSAPAASKMPPTTKPTQAKSRPPSSSSSETSSDEATVVKIPPKTTSTTPKGSENSKSQQASPALRSANGAQRQAASVAAPPRDDSDSDSEEEIKLVIRRPVQQPGVAGGQSPLAGGRGQSPLGAGRGQFPWRGRGQSPLAGGRGHTPWRGRGRGQGGRGEEGGWGRGRGAVRGRGGSSSFGFSYDGAEEPSRRTDQLTNLSVVLQNGAEGAPKPDYSSMPLLAAPPQVGQKIAFKLLELSENYTPEVSEYKEGKIVSLDLTTKQIELELLNSSPAPVKPGKFDLVYENPDGSESVERVEYAICRDSRVTERWDSLLEPRLII
ncbi:coilin [Cebidichthys violaceus]|uniref:coilin n=1 Tax=Cebidichthys violaceus TaxID=271503 RepID=UPI0035C9D530